MQAQTEVIWRALSKMGIPALFFINKTDREGADVDSVLAELAELTGRRPARVPLDDRAALAETLAEHDDAALEKYLEEGAEGFSDDELASLLTRYLRVQTMSSPRCCSNAFIRKN